MDLFADSRAQGQGKPKWLPQGIDPTFVLLVMAGVCALYVPTFWNLVNDDWAAESQGHELLIVLVSGWLLYARREQLARLSDTPSPIAGTVLMVLGLIMYVLGRTTEVVRLELFSMIIVLASLLLCLSGTKALRCAWFPLFFLLFAIPLPPDIVLAITGPLKSAVSAVATKLMYWIGLPVGRSGVVITIGQYQLLIVEACAGLQTMFTLEAMGLLYASLSTQSIWRNLFLSVLVVPIAFTANVVRVMVLAVVTYMFGDAAGQGFLHGFSGIVLFVVALALIMASDGMLRRLARQKVSAS